MMEHLPKNKSPGPDGIPHELYKWMITHEVLGPSMLRLFNLVLDTMEFPPSRSRTVMIMLFKKANPGMHKNWRPLSLINADAKMFTKLMATRLMFVQSSGLS
jgi:hypothetical protein